MEFKLGYMQYSHAVDKEIRLTLPANRLFVDMTVSTQKYEYLRFVINFMFRDKNMNI